ncbi:DNA mismatch repair protein MSH1, mitochondrial-like protein [Drosera capensis]
MLFIVFLGLSRSARGYSIVLILETMKTFSTEDGLTEEALVSKLRTYRCHYLFLHGSLKHNASGTCRWGEFGEGGLLWAECSSRQFEWFDGDPVTELLTKVKEVYGLEDEVIFRNVTVPSEGRPRPLHLGTATQIGAIPTEGIPCLLNVLLPPSCTGLPVLYMRDLLLNPPPYAIASTIQEICKTMSKVTCSLPEFTCVSSAKLVKLIELREANHVEFCRIKNVADEVSELYSNAELSKILKLLMDPTWMATGLKIEFDTLVSECEWISRVIGEMISLDNDVNQEISSYPHIPDEFFEDIESSWKGRVKKIHLEDLYREVELAARALHLAVIEDFLPIVTRVKIVTAPLGGPKGEILYAREQQAVWFKGKRFVPSVWAGTPGEAQIKQLKPSLDAKGRKVGEEWFTTAKVEEALLRYHMSNDKARAKVLELLRHLSSELQSRINILVFASMLLIIAKALFAHVSEGRRRNWIFPTLVKFLSAESSEPLGEVRAMKLNGLLPYWFDTAKGSPVRNTLHMQSLFLLTGPNGGGKSSLLRSVCAAALLGICGLMVPAESALIPHFDSIFLHMLMARVLSRDHCCIEMSEVRSIITGTTSKSLVLIDEVCRGTETAKGTCIAGSIMETLDARGCLGIVSTHLHGIFDLPLTTVNTVCKAMSAECVNGQIVPTWKLMDGICRESLAFETAQREGIPETLIQRAEELYRCVYTDGLLRKTGNEEYRKVTTSEEYVFSDVNNTGFDEGDGCPGVLTRKTLHSETQSGEKMGSGRAMEILEKDVRKAVSIICEKKLVELHKGLESPEFSEINCVLVAARQQPPPTTISASCVYVLLQPDRKLYVGQTDGLQGRVRAHRSKDGMQNAAFLYFVVQGKSLACKMETLLINQLPSHGFHLTNVADGKHRNFGSSDTILEDVAVCR